MVRVATGHGEGSEPQPSVSEQRLQREKEPSSVQTTICLWRVEEENGHWWPSVLRQGISSSSSGD